MTVDRARGDRIERSDESTKRSIRVLVAGPYPPPTGGIATVLRNIFAIDFDGKVELELFDTRQFPRPRGMFFRLLNRLSSLLPPAGVWTLLTNYMARDFARALREQKPDVVHLHASHGYGFWSTARLVRIAEKEGIKTIFHSHGSSMDVFYDGLPALAKFYYRRCLERPDLCIALSEAWYEWFSQLLPERKLDVVPNCIAWSKFQREGPGRNAETPTILFIGVMFGRRKGIHDLIAVVPEILDVFPGARFLLAGSDDEGVEASMQVDVRTRNAITFTGDLDPEGVREAYANATCFVLPAYHEGMPMVMLEAMASGLPVVCSAINAIPEVISHDVNGLLIEPGDQRALAGSILALLGDTDLRLRLGEGARAHIEEHHNLARQKEWLFEIYRRVALGLGSRRTESN